MDKFDSMAQTYWMYLYFVGELKYIFIQQKRSMHIFPSWYEIIN